MAEVDSEGRARRGIESEERGRPPPAALRALVGVLDDEAGSCRSARIEVTVVRESPVARTSSPRLAEPDRRSASTIRNRFTSRRLASEPPRLPSSASTSFTRREHLLLIDICQDSG